MSLQEQAPPRGNKSSSAGWYADPLGSPKERYWNGATWELQVREANGRGPKTAAADTQNGSASNGGRPKSPRSTNLETTDGDGLRGFIRRRPLTAILSTGGLALLLGIGLGVAGNQSEVNDLNDQVASLKSDLAGADQAAADAQGEASAAEDQASAAADAAAQQVAALEGREGEVAEREEAVSAAEQTLEQSTIPDGIWELGRDYEPGLHRSEGGSLCYWALLGSANTNDIINNGGFGPNQTVQIDSPFFETSDCGEWTKIG